MPDSPSADLSDPPARPLDPVGTRPRPLPGARPRPAAGAGLDAARTLEDNARAMLRVARRYSYCEDDAHDAVQAAAERFLKHRGEIAAETATGWLVTVARNEALRVRERRGRTGAIEDDDRRLVHTGDGPEDLASRGEELSLAREALGRLKPQERLALWLQAEGPFSSYYGRGVIVSLGLVMRVFSGFRVLAVLRFLPSHVGGRHPRNRRTVVKALQMAG
jgi:RNA polymerase sigma factor (sigma-70 family)